MIDSTTLRLCKLHNTVHILPYDHLSYPIMFHFSSKACDSLHRRRYQEHLPPVPRTTTGKPRPVPTCAQSGP